jgi:hypothetical protein
MIVPAGNMKIEWSPKDTNLVKTASTEVKEEVNALYEAAKLHLASSECCKECKAPKNFCKCEKKDAKSDSASSDAKSDVKTAGISDMNKAKDSGFETSDKASDSVSDATSDSAIIEVETPAGEKTEGDPKDCIEVAVEKIEEGVAELKDAAQISEVSEEKEIEIEVEAVPEAPVAKEVALDIPGKEISNNEIIVESTPEHTCSCASKTKVTMDKSASSEEFCRFAMLSKANKQKIKNYWTMLGFPKDYVDLMTKDYEK